MDTGELLVDTVVTGPVARVRLDGELDAHTSEELVDALDGLLRCDASGAPLSHVEVDGSGLTFVDSAGLRAIVLGLVQATNAGIAFEVSAASEPFARVLSITGLDDALVRDG